MKKIITAAFAFMLLGATANAQTKEDGGKHKMHQELGLTADQKAEMKRIHDAEKSELEALKNDTKLTKEQSVAARKAIHEKYRTQFRNVLTEEQQKKAVEMRKQDGDHKKMKKDSSFHKAAAPRNAKAKHRGDMMHGDAKKDVEAGINLTAEQKTRMAASREEFKAQAEAIKKNDKLTREQKQEAMKTLSEKQKEEFKSLLTEEQKKKLESRGKGEMKKNK